MKRAPPWMAACRAGLLLQVRARDLPPEHAWPAPHSPSATSP